MNHRRHRMFFIAALSTGACAAFVGCGNGDANDKGLEATAGLAILNSDFAVTSVSLYDPGSAHLSDECVNSDGSSAALAQPLSGDVTLPSRPQNGGELVLIDRLNAVVSFVNPQDCKPRGQISVSTGGFKGNPRDIVSLSATKAYVTRYETNAAPTDDPTDFDEGDDILVIDPRATGATAQPILKRISLAPYATAVDGAVIQARPDRAVLVDGKVYVTLGNMDAMFKVVAQGRVVVIDSATDTVSGTIDLPANQKGCSAIDYVAATKRLYVACGGSFSDADQAAGSGLIEIDLAADGGPVARMAVAATDLGTTPINLSSATVLGDTAYVATFGTLAADAPSPDAFYAVPLAGGAPIKLLEGGAFNLGRAVVDRAGRRIFIPDGDAVMPRVHVFNAAASAAVQSEPFVANPSGGLPPREIAWY